MCDLLKRLNLYHIPYTIDNLPPRTIVDVKKIPEMRRNTNILVIDDSGFVLIEALRKYGYQVNEKKDLDSVNDVAAYDIILCDIRGVGKFLNSKYEGAKLIQEIKLKYPSKKVIAYTAEDFSPSYSNLIDFADKKVEKGTSVDDWTSLLDDSVKDKYDLKKQWLMTRDALIKESIPIRLVAEYESEYVNAISKGSIDKLIQRYTVNQSNGFAVMIELLKLTNNVLSLILKFNGGVA